MKIDDLFNSSMEILGRSELETWGHCPRQAQLCLEHPHPVGTAAQVGSEAHNIMSEVITEWIDSEGAQQKSDIVDSLVAYTRGARPDIQPQVLSHLAPSYWTLADLLWHVHPTNVLRYDGGEGALTGQISEQMEMGNESFRLTCELDLLTATESPEILNLWDWKSGWKKWTYTDVASSFQFNFYAWLVLANYPDIKAVDVRIVRTCDNYVTSVWRASRMHDYRARVRSALGEYCKHKALKVAPAWPAPEKCAWCPVISNCDVAPPDLTLIAEAPGAAVDWLVKNEEYTKKVKDALGDIVDNKAGEIPGDVSGVVFGRGKTTGRKKPLALYEARDK